MFMQVRLHRRICAALEENKGRERTYGARTQIDDYEMLLLLPRVRL